MTLSLALLALAAACLLTAARLAWVNAAVRSMQQAADAIHAASTRFMRVKPKAGKITVIL